MTVPSRNRRLSLAAGALALTLAATTACASKKPTGTLPSPAPGSAAPTPSVEPSVASAEQQARAAYAGYIQTWAIASQQADPDNPDLARYVADPLLSLTRHNIRRLKDIGAVQIGTQKATVVNVQVDLAAKPPTVTITSCLDYSDLRLVYKSNQSPVPNSSGGDPKVPSVATVWLYLTGQWLVNNSKQGSHTC